MSHEHEKPIVNLSHEEITEQIIPETLDTVGARTGIFDLEKEAIEKALAQYESEEKPFTEPEMIDIDEASLLKRLRLLESFMLLDHSPTLHEILEKRGTYNEYRVAVEKYNKDFSKPGIDHAYVPQINTREGAEELITQWIQNGRGEVIQLKYPNNRN